MGKEFMNFLIRRAALKDAEFVFNLRNEPAVREASFNKDEIDFARHLEWFRNKIQSKDCILYIIELDGFPIAQVRFDLVEGSMVDISIAITENFRGKGLGPEILKKTSQKLFEILPEITEIHAYIKKENSASLKGFSRAGYLPAGESSQKGLECFKMILTR